MSEIHTFEEHLLRAARRILQPLVRILLRNGVTANVFQELARKVFVDVAYKEFGIEGRRQTLARVSVITGLNRKEVSRLHKMAELTNEDKVWWNRAGTVIAGWTTDKSFQTRAGYPLDLPFSGKSPNFTDLVNKYSGDMYPRSVADELLRLDAVEDIDGTFRLTSRGYVPNTDPGSMVDILGADTSELIETIDHNIQADADSKLLQAKVLANNLPEAHIDAFNEYSKRILLNAIEDLTHWLTEYDAGKDHEGNDARFEAGVGFFQINRVLRHRIITSENEGAAGDKYGNEHDS